MYGAGSDKVVDIADIGPAGNVKSKLSGTKANPRSLVTLWEEFLTLIGACLFSLFLLDNRLERFNDCLIDSGKND